MKPPTKADGVVVVSTAIGGLAIFIAGLLTPSNQWLSPIGVGLVTYAIGHFTALTGLISPATLTKHERD